MVTAKLSARWKRNLANLPETSMGYQRVDVYLKGGKALTNISVYNGEYLETSEPVNAEDITDIRLHQDD